jgi:hypothetical protein
MAFSEGIDRLQAALSRVDESQARLVIGMDPAFACVSARSFNRVSRFVWSVVSENTLR